MQVGSFQAETPLMRVSVRRLKYDTAEAIAGSVYHAPHLRLAVRSEEGEDGVGAADKGGIVMDRVEFVVDVTGFAFDKVAVLPVLAGRRGGG